MWDTASGQELLTLRGKLIARVAFSPDGKQLAVGILDDTTRIYTLDQEELKALAQERVTHSLTDEECRQYLHLDSCP